MHVQEVSEFGLQEKVFQNLIRRISKELFTIGVFCCNVSYQKVSFNSVTSWLNIISTRYRIFAKVR